MRRLLVFLPNWFKEVCLLISLDDFCSACKTSLKMTFPPVWFLRLDESPCAFDLLREPIGPGVRMGWSSWSLTTAYSCFTGGEGSWNPFDGVQSPMSPIYSSSSRLRLSSLLILLRPQRVLSPIRMLLASFDTPGLEFYETSLFSFFRKFYCYWLYGDYCLLFHCY